MRLSPLNVVGIGDAENDTTFLQACGCAAAVANALPMVKANADIVTSAPRGAGVAQTIGRILDSDLADLAPRTERQAVEFAPDSDGEPVRLHPQCGLLIIGDRRLLTRAAGAEDRGTDPHMGGAEADSLLEIGAHAHAEEAEPGASGDLAQQGEMRCGLLVEWRDAH